nr:hypothetical protein [Tanacetum cinerariifolium]
MAGYKMEHFRGMTYDKVRPIFEREYKKVQTLFKPDKDVEEPKKKRVADETLLQESFKKLKAVEVSVSEFKVEALQVKYPIIDFKIHTKGSRTYWKIIRVGGITEAYQSFKDMLKGFDREDLVALWSLVKEKFSLAVYNVDKEKALWVELKRLFEPDVDDVLWKLQREGLSLVKWSHDPDAECKIDTAAEVIEEFTLSGYQIAKIDKLEDIESGGGDEEETESDEESAEEETREEEEESFD